jgi:predicted nucleic acid-binding protein
MAYKIFLDINIIADFFDTDRTEYSSAKNLFEEMERGHIHGFFSESVVNTSCYILRKIVSQSQFKDLMTDLISFIKVLPCSTIIIEEAYKNAKNDLEDAVLYQIALSGKMDYFITHDRKHLKKIEQRSLPIISSKEMIEILNP